MRDDTHLELNSSEGDSPTQSTWKRLRQALPLGNFFFAMFCILVFVAAVFLITTSTIVARDTQLAEEWVLSNTVVGLSILGHGLQLDPDARKLSVLWRVDGCHGPADRTPEDVRNIETCGLFGSPLDIYLNDPSEPAFSHRSYELKGESTVIRDLSFTTEHPIGKYGEWDRTKQFMVPFDHYIFSAFVFAIDPTTNRSIHIDIFAVAGTLGDFVIRSHGAIAVNKFTYDLGDGAVTAQVDSRTLLAEIRRSTIAQVFAIGLFLVNWLLTVSSVYTTAMVTSRKQEANSAIVGIPLSTLFGIPTIHSLYATSPPLGTSIDTAAFFVQIATVALCLLTLLKVSMGTHLH